MRVALGAVGVVVQVVGLVLLLDQGFGDVVHAVVWLGAGVVAHDAVLAPLAALAVVAGARVLPPWARVPVTVGVVVLATVTIAVSPTLLRLGATPADPTLLDRPYGTSWLAFAGLVALGAAVAAAVNRGRQRPAAAVRD